jgi:hypothetical protein
MIAIFQSNWRKENREKKKRKGKLLGLPKNCCCGNVGEDRNFGSGYHSTNYINSRQCKQSEHRKF